MLEVIDFFSQKHFVNFQRLLLGREFPVAVRACVCLVRLPGSSDITLWTSARKEQPAPLISRPKLSSTAARCPVFTPDALLLIRLSKS